VLTDELRAAAELLVAEGGRLSGDCRRLAAVRVLAEGYLADHPADAPASIRIPAPTARRLLAFVRGWTQAHADADRHGLPGAAALEDARGLAAELAKALEGI
jgi:hypothetical protein